MHAHVHMHAYTHAHICVWQIHMHTHTYIYIYISIYTCVHRIDIATLREQGAFGRSPTVYIAHIHKACVKFCPEIPDALSHTPLSFAAGSA